MKAATSELKEISGFTWPGIEFGEPPSYKYSFFEYVDALRLGDLDKFLEVEETSGDWWHVRMDRGAGAALHFAVDHGQMKCVKFLVEERGAEINQQDVAKGWTPLMRCARMAHYTNAPYLAVFEYLLTKGADASIMTDIGFPDREMGGNGPPLALIDVAAEKGRGWEAGEVRAMLTELVNKHAGVVKQPVFKYEGPAVGPVANAIFEEWEAICRAVPGGPIVPPDNWRAPPPAGYVEAQGMRRVEKEPWRPAGTDDGSCYLRKMTKEELEAQAAAV